MEIYGMEDNVTLGCKCKYQCKTIQSLGLDIGNLYPEFLTLDNNAQRTYLLGQIHLQNVARRRHGTYSDPSESRRQVTIRYTVPDGQGGNVQVCSRTFKNFFGITSRKLQTLQTKKKKGCLIYCDGRGKSSAKKKSHLEEERYLVPAIFTSSSLQEYQDCYTVPETGKTPEKEARSDESWLEENEFNPGLKVEDCGDLDSEEVCHPQSLTEQEHTEHPSCSSFADVEFALLHLHQEKLLLELEKLSEERERIATEKKNVILHSEILKLRLQLMGCSRSAQMGINCGSNNVGTENFPENVNVSVPSHSVQQFQNSSTDKPKSSGSALGTEPKLTQTSITTGSIHAENPLIKINRPPNMNSTSIYKQSSSTSNYSVSFQPNKRPVLSDTVKNSCGLPVDIPSSASHFLAPLIDIDIRTVTPSMTHLNIVQTGINNGKTSEISRSPQVGLIPQDYKSQQQRLLCAKPTPQSMPTTNSKDVLAVSPTLKAGSNPPPVASNKTILHQMVNSSQLNSPSQLERSRKAQESTDDFIVLHSKDSSVEWKKGVFVSSSDSTAGSVPRVKEKVDIESPSKKLRLSTEDSR